MSGLVLTIIAVLLRIVSNPVANVFQKQLTASNNHPLMVNFITYFSLSFVCVFFSFTVRWVELQGDFWIYSILGGMVGAFGNGFLVKALQNGDLSVLGPINSYKSVVGILVAILLLGEIPSVWGFLGIALIIYGSYFVLETTEDKFSWALLKRKEIQFRVWALILTAIEAVFVKKVILASSPVISFISWCWFGALFSFFLLFLYNVNGKNEIKQLQLSTVSKYVYLTICIGTMQLTTNYVFNNMPVGYALSLFQLSTIVSVVLGHRIFKEQGIVKKLIGSGIMIIGSIIIILFQKR